MDITYTYLTTEELSERIKYDTARFDKPQGLRSA